VLLGSAVASVDISEVQFKTGEGQLKERDV